MINKNNSNALKKQWIKALNDKKFVAFAVTLIVVFAIQMTFISQFQSQIEMRNGVSFADPITGNLPTFNFDIITFIAIYSAQILGIILAFFKPEKFLQLLLGYFFVYFFRIFSQYLLPLEPPAGIIPLNDPFLIWFGNGVIINKDLFYSGHTSTTFIVFLITENTKAKIFIFAALLVVILGILLQKVHYTIDVYAAFFFAFTAYRLGIFILKKLKFYNYSIN
jgi:membrane-associated phospholipid phosphatase